MRILIRKENYSVINYTLCLGNTTLDFIDNEEKHSIPYTQVSDFCITLGKEKKTWFTMLYDNKMLEGQILDITEVDTFTTALKEKLGGVINIDVKR